MPHGVMWFRRDLRVTSNPAWAAATSENSDVTALYVLDPALFAASGPFRIRQLVGELQQLDHPIREGGGRLRVHRGDPRSIVPQVAAQLDASRVYWNADVTPYANARDGEVCKELRVDPSTWWGGLVLSPGSVRSSNGLVPRVFGAFQRAWTRAKWSDWSSAGDARIADDAGETLGDLTTHEAPPRPPGEDRAHEALQ